VGMRDLARVEAAGCLSCAPDRREFRCRLERLKVWDWLMRFTRHYSFAAASITRISSGAGDWPTALQIARGSSSPRL
jgi:hypothetical protein